MLQSLTDRIYKCLVRREHSIWELKSKFRGFASESIIDSVIEGFTQRGEQSDLRFSEMLCRSRFNRGKGPIALLNELQEHRIDPEIIENVMAEYEDKWDALANRIRSRKFGDQPPSSFKEWSRQARFMQQRGFSVNYIEPYSN